MNPRLFLYKLHQSLREEGIFGTMRRIVAQLNRNSPVDSFDARYGSSTVGDEPLWKLNVNSPNAKFGRRYGPINPEVLRTAVQELRIDPAVFAFIDLGSGKGRALLVAAELGFGQVIGIEFARELVEISNANLGKLGFGNAMTVYGDAAEYVFPDHDLVIFLHNPFSEQIMVKVMDHLENACSSHQNRQAYIIYVNALCAEIIDRAPWFERISPQPPIERTIIWKKRDRIEKT